MDVEAVLFDLDGVLTATAAYHREAWQHLFDGFLPHEEQRLGRAPRAFTDEDYRRLVDGKPRMDGLTAVLRDRGIDVPVGRPDDDASERTLHGLCARKNDHYLRLLAEHGPEVFPDAVALASQLRERGYRLGVVSASRNAHGVLRMAGLESLFPVVVDGVEATRLGLAGKPDPATFLEAARRLGVAPGSTAVIEDAPAGLQAACDGGFRAVIGVARNGSLKGTCAHLVVQRLSALSFAPRPHRGPPSALDHLDLLMARIHGRRLLVFLDYDGTLTPIVERPELAVLDDDVRAVLRGLSKQCGLAIVSGRDAEEVRGLVGIDVWCAGSHGLDLLGPGQRHERAHDALPALERAEQVLRRRLADVPGTIVERKRFGVAAHYRLVAPERQDEVKRVASEVAAAEGLRHRSGKKVAEVVPDVDWDKGRAVQWLAAELAPDEDVFPLVIGDDATDEDAFRAVWGHGLGIVVMEHPRPTLAELRLRGPDEVNGFLRRLSGLLAAARPADPT